MLYKMNVKIVIAIIFVGLFYACESKDSLMKKEADDFLVKMGTELQPKQRDAIIAAINGDTEELERVRNARNTQPVYPSNVKVTYPTSNTRLYTNTETNVGNKPLLVYLHGGGWTIGGLNSCAKFCGEICSSGGVSVLAVDYRLAPEYPYPIPLDDCEEAIRFALENAEKWGCSANSVFVGGDSSGGNLAIASVLRMKKGDISGLLLFYPVTKAWNDGSQSWIKYGKGFGLDGDLMEAFNQSYISSEQAVNEEISTSCAKDEALKQLPRTLLIAAGRDILADQGKEFADRMVSLGVDAVRVEYPEAVHLFITVPGQNTAFNEAVKEAIGFMNRE